MGILEILEEISSDSGKNNKEEMLRNYKEN